MKKDNRGFSLIELIIVIAIMAVLVAVITPNLTKYLSKAKKETDAKNLDEIHNAVMIATAEADMSNPKINVMSSGASGAVYVFKYDSATNRTVFDSSDSRNSNSVANFSTLITDEIGSAKINSSSGQNKVVVSITVGANGEYSITEAFAN